MDSNKSIPESLNELNEHELYGKFQEFLRDPYTIQKEILFDILNHGKSSEFGIKHSFKDIKSIEEFQKNVPVSEYSDYLDDIEKIKKGKEDILFNGKAHSIVVSSGTTGNMKYFPDSERGLIAKNLVMKLRSIQLALICPGLLDNPYILGITNSSDYGFSEGGIPMMAASGQGLNSYEDSHIKMVLPQELIQAKNISNENKDYLMALFTLASKNLTAVVCNNLAHFNFLLKEIKNNTLKMIDDLDNHSISLNIDPHLKEILISKFPDTKERVEELKKIYSKKGELKAEDIWPNFKTVGCWLSSSVGRCALDIKRNLSEDVDFLEWGYGASEGKFNVPFKANISAGPVSPFSSFFEFLPIDGGEIVTLDKVEEKKLYELIITSYSGLYRYNLHDIVLFKGKTLKTPNIEFECKASENTICNDIKIYANQFDHVLKQTEKDSNEFISFFQVIPSDDKKTISYLIEPSSNNDSSDFNKLRFKENLVKNLKNDLKLELNKLFIMKSGYRDSLFVKVVSPGKTITSTKLATVVSKDSILESYIKEIL
ncbi:GH3 auxin-responsive promoter [Methanobrevibacter cuticularis]|uniref:GH3 auxin-responsive promoter n=1 Tax=Methanobrevibacter cuticularis TaxID=47311 RepID=A0A166ENQ6_9EURY|nr:GH3 auxin-responsive promoter family protein [Methanobrevibacter cuticularis]KZX16851.1 GH3 auxin-responsive promoter [Methanobrevibacter cuticularis]